MFNLSSIIDITPFSLEKATKRYLYREALGDLTRYHRDHCVNYAKILEALGYNSEDGELESVPFIPVRLFKEYELLSVDKSQVIKTMTSSGTTGQRVSRICLDRATSTYQTKVLTKIVSSFIGSKRLPMLVIDTSSVIKDRTLFSARGAGIIGFSMLGYDITYALDENMRLDIDCINDFLKKHKDEPILLFGFTYMIWEYFYKPLNTLGVKLPLERGILIHGGGWKKIVEQSVDNATFKAGLNEVCNISRVHNYYGMVEQTGSIFMECEEGHLHASIFSDVVTRDFKDFSCVKNGAEGIVQILSLIPLSYPGHSLLSEDLGVILGEDDCPCGRLGKYFSIHGRIKNAEIRGCGDTYATSR